MARRRHTPEQIIRKLREADRLLGEGAEVADWPYQWPRSSTSVSTFIFPAMSAIERHSRFAHSARTLKCPWIHSGSQPG
jgi:hypothetical protein